MIAPVVAPQAVTGLDPTHLVVADVSFIDARPLARFTGEPLITDELRVAGWSEWSCDPALDVEAGTSEVGQP